MPTLTETGCRLSDFVEVLADRTDPAHYPHAAAVEQEVLIYDRDGLLAAPAEELVHALSAGPGVVVIRGAYPDVAVVDATTAVFEELMTRERVEGGGAGDHFAPFGLNERVWNALEKLAVSAPEVFVDYYANDVVAAIANAWLGPNYQVTSQVNVVVPGGKAQSGHRDYHLGFLHAETIARFPEHVQRMSPLLTLQGAVAHTDMPVESGPTMYLPHSQKYVPGYLAMNRPDFQAYFEEHHIQLPLRRGDAAFFNPARLPRRRAPTARPTCGGSPTCCRSPRRSGARWRAWTARGSARRSTRRCGRTRDPDAARSRRRRRATRSRPTSTATPPSTASRRRARPTWCGRRWPRAGTRPRFRAALDANTWLHATH